MKTHRDEVAAALSLALGVTSMAIVLATGLYAQAASAEARGDQALFQTMAPQSADAAGAAPVWLAVNDARL